ncbi:hypothetical protein D3C78_822330 [compost metagenome]
MLLLQLRNLLLQPVPLLKPAVPPALKVCSERLLLLGSFRFPCLLTIRAQLLMLQPERIQLGKPALLAFLPSALPARFLLAEQRLPLIHCSFKRLLALRKLLLHRQLQCLQLLLLYPLQLNDLLVLHLLKLSKLLTLRLLKLSKLLVLRPLQLCQLLILLAPERGNTLRVLLRQPHDRIFLRSERLRSCGLLRFSLGGSFLHHFRKPSVRLGLRALQLLNCLPLRFLQLSLQLVRLLHGLVKPLLQGMHLGFLFLKPRILTAQPEHFLRNLHRRQNGQLRHIEPRIPLGKLLHRLVNRACNPFHIFHIGVAFKLVLYTIYINCNDSLFRIHQANPPLVQIAQKPHRSSLGTIRCGFEGFLPTYAILRQKIVPIL